MVDVRGAFTSVGRSDGLAAPRGLRANELPKTVKGLDFGVHLYPVRRKVTLGLGADVLMASGRQGVAAAEDGTVDETAAEGEFAIRGVLPQLSLNFGTGRGWSYIGAGMGLSKIRAGRSDATALDYGPNLRTLHLGGGARWFVSQHVAVSFDLRYYRVAARALEADYVGNPSFSMFVTSAGLSFK